VDEHVAILPLAVLMMLGPQITVSVFLVTSRDPIRNSLAYIGAITATVTIGIIVAAEIAKLIGADPDNSGTSDTGQVVKYALVAALAVLSLRTFLKRDEVEAPKWMASLQDATPRSAARLGLLLILLMPTDVMVILGTAGYLVANGLNWYDSWPLVLATVLFAATPLIGYLLFRGRAERAMPQVRDWMNSHSWLISIVVYVFFIAVLLS